MNNSKRRRAILVCPHYLSWVPNGANLYCKWVAEALSTHFDVDWIDSFGIHAETPAQPRSKKKAREQSSILASIRSLIFKSNYFSERLVPRHIQQTDFPYDDYDLVVISFIHTHQALYKSISKTNKPVIILTHNYDIDIFERWLGDSGLRSLVAKSSLPSYLKHLKNLGRNTTLAHISALDNEKYKKLTSANSIIINPTIHLPRAFKESEERTVNLAFLGSLATPFNIEALHYFSNKIEPQLRAAMDFKFHLFGSTPTKAVVKLANEKKWDLYADLDDLALDTHLAKMTAGVMPFQYSQGIKLKAYHFFSLGIPILATSCISQPEGFEDAFLSSDDLNTWCDFILRIKSGSLDFQSIRLRALNSRQSSLEKIAQDLNNVQILKNSPPAINEQ